MKIKILLLVTIFILPFFSCKRMTPPDKVYYEVVKFEQMGDVEVHIKNNIHPRNNIKKPAHLFDIVLVNGNDTVRRKVVSDKVYRFYPGDSVYYVNNRYKLKKK